jgi:hypothetical protein
LTEEIEDLEDPFRGVLPDGRNIALDVLLAGRVRPDPQDATGTLVMRELQALHLDRVQTELSGRTRFRAR